MSVLIDLRLERVDPGRGHVRAADRLDLLDRPELFVVQDLVKVDCEEIECMFFKKKCAIPDLFLFIFNTVDNKQLYYIKFLPMTGFEPQTSGVRGDHSTN